MICPECKEKNKMKKIQKDEVIYICLCGWKGSFEEYLERLNIEIKRMYPFGFPPDDNSMLFGGYKTVRLWQGQED